MNGVKVTDLSEETRAIPHPVTTFQQAFTNYRNSVHVQGNSPCTYVIHAFICVLITADILDEITKAGFKNPTPIQVHVQIHVHVQRIHMCIAGCMGRKEYVVHVHVHVYVIHWL